MWPGAWTCNGGELLLDLSDMLIKAFLKVSVVGIWTLADLLGKLLLSG